jgi:hypothetical protein
MHILQETSLSQVTLVAMRQGNDNKSVCQGMFIKGFWKRIRVMSSVKLQARGNYKRVWEFFAHVSICSMLKIS